MIEGLKVTITGSELAELCAARAKHHADRADFYRRKADELEAGGAESENYSGGDPVRNLRDSMSKHQGSADEMRFIASHIVAGEEYLLTRDDLYRIGIVNERYA